MWKRNVMKCFSGMADNLVLRMSENGLECQRIKLYDVSLKQVQGTK